MKGSRIWVVGVVLFSSVFHGVQCAPLLSSDSTATTERNHNGGFEVDSSWSFILPVINSVFIEQEDLTQPTKTITASDKVPGNCTEPSINDFPTDLFSVTELRQGAVILHILAALYIFYAIAHLCEEFFVPAVNSICAVLHIPTDVAGATFMAIATSSPEFFTNVVGTFVTEGDIGVGSVVGSVVFNLLAIISWCGLAVKDGLQLEWWPLTRDCGFYVFSVISLIAVLWDGRVYWYESLLFILAYVIYLIVICKNERIQSYFRRSSIELEAEDECPDVLPPSRSIRRIPTTERLGELLIKSLSYDGLKSSNESTPLLSDKSGRYVLTAPSSVVSSVNFDGKVSRPKRKRHHNIREVSSSPNMRQAVLAENLRNGRGFKRPFIATKEASSLETDVKPEVAVARSWAASVHSAFTWPVRTVLHLTVPDCRTDRWARWYPATFFMCILYMAIFSYLITWMMTVIGYTLKVPDAVTGLTFIAAGTSLPEALSSIIVARQGQGTMSISNSVGSNTFNILICLGLPWLIRSILLSAQGGPAFVLMTDGGFGYVSVFLVASAVALYCLIACNRFVLDKKIAIVALVMYGIFLVFASLLELNFFFPVNPPTCSER